MANILGLAMKITADAGGLPASLSPVERAFEKLGEKADAAVKVFDQFKATSSGAAEAQAGISAKFDALAESLRSGSIDAKAYAEGFAALQKEVRSTADAFSEGLRVTEASRTEEEKRAAQLTRLDELLKLGAISEETHARATAEASGANAAAAAAEKERSDAMAAAARIIQQNMTAQERYDAQVQELRAHLDAGRLTQEQYDRALEKASQDFAKAESAAKGYDSAAESAGKAGTLKFNELSGILSALPGPLGDIAGRFSGLASAGEGLGRVFSAGLSGGISAIGASVTALVNPFTLAVAGFAGLAAAATSVVSGLSNMEAETEKLSNAASKLGVSFSFLETLKQSAEMSGVSFESVNASMTKLLRTLAGADEESKQASAALSRVGVSLDDLNGKSSDEKLRLISEKLADIEDPAKRAAAAVAIFGRAGTEILPALQGITQAEQVLTRFNARLTETDVNKVLALGDSLDSVKAAFKGFGNELLTPFIGVTKGISDGLASLVASIGKNFGAILDAISPVTSAIGLLVNGFLQVASAITNFVGTALEPAAAAGRIVSGVIEKMSDALTAVFGRITDAINGFRDFFKFEGVATAFANVFDKIGETVSRVATIISTAASKIGDFVSATFGKVVDVVGSAVSKFLEFAGVGQVISAFASKVASAFSGLWDNIKAVVNQIGGFVDYVLKFAEEWLGISNEIEKPIIATVEVDNKDALEKLAKQEEELKKASDFLTASLSKGIQDVSQFGQAGFEIAQKYEKALQDIAAAAEDAGYTIEEVKAAQEQARAEFDRSIKTLEEQRKAQEEVAKAARQVTEENKKIVDSLLEQKRIQEQFGGDTRRAQAAKNVAAIEQEILRIEKEIAAAREAGDQDAVNAGTARLAQLDQIKAQEQDIASGAAAEREREAERAKKAQEEAQKLADERKRQEEEIRQKIEKNEQEIFDKRTELTNAIYDLEKARLEEINSIRSGGIQVGDIRTNEGANTFLDLLGGKQDEAIAEYKKNTKELQGLRKDIQKLQMQKVDILGGVG